MRTLLVTHYFPPEMGAPQARLSELARHWTQAGDDVTVLTGMPNHPTGIVPPDYKGSVRRTEHVDGYRIVRTCLYATPNEGLARKTLSHLSFMTTSVLLGGRKSGPADVVVASSPTFFILLSAWLLARIKHARLVVEIRDLWPAIFVQLGVLTSPFLIRLLERLELAVYHAADAVVVLSEGFRDDLIGRGIPAEKVSTIYNGVDLERFGPHVERTDLTRRHLGAGPNDTLVLYIGAHGISHGLTSVADAAAKLDGTPVRFAFIGEGAQKRSLGAHVKALGVTNVTLLPGVPRDEVPAILAASDICLVPLRDVPLFKTFIPSKMFEHLGANKAVIGALAGEAAGILAEAGGVVVPPEDSAALADAILDLAGNPQRRCDMGEQGRRYVEEYFDRRILAERYRELLESVL